MPELEYTTDTLATALYNALPQFVVYLIGFLAIGTIWTGHHRRFQYIQTYDHTLILINILFLSAIAFIPFPARIVTAYPNETAVALYAAVSGGHFNVAQGVAAAIGGGDLNMADDYAVVPGGFENTAAGSYSLAAGRRAQAAHAGSFVWADSTDASLSSTGTNQFIVRASGAY